MHCPGLSDIGVDDHEPLCPAGIWSVCAAPRRTLGQSGTKAETAVPPDFTLLAPTLTKARKLNDPEVETWKGTCHRQIAPRPGKQSFNAATRTTCTSQTQPSNIWVCWPFSQTGSCWLRARCLVSPEHLARCFCSHYFCRMD